MEARVEGKEVLLEKLLYRGLGFGQSVNGCLLNASMSMSLSELENVIDREFNLFSSEMKKDAECFGDPIETLQSLGYSEFSEAVVLDPAAVACVIKEYLFFELLEGIFGGNEGRDFQYVINSIEELSINGDRVQMRCMVFRRLGI